MPTYQYTCTACDERLEAVQSFTDAALSECPACGGRLRKVFSAVGVVFKGSGFYKNDSREGAKSGTSKAKDGESSGSADSSGGDKASGDKAGAVKAESSSGGEKTAAAPAANGAAKSAGATSGSGAKTTPAPAGKTS